MEKKSKKSLSCRKAFIRHLRIFVSDGMINERKEIRRSRITNFRDDRSLCYNGFTLIELLVVVLIIGILAAVAVPQYKMAVYKSRYAKLELLAKEYVQAAQAYRLATGEWPSEFDVLPINPTGTVATPTGSDCRKTNDMFCCLAVSVSGNQNAAMSCGLLDYSLFYLEGLGNSSRHCFAKSNDSTANNLCASRGNLLGNGGPSGHNVITPTGHYTGVKDYQIKN